MARRNRVQPGTPTAVTKASKKADELHEQIYGKVEDDKVEPEAAEAPGAENAGEGGNIQPVEAQAQPDSTGDTSTASTAEEAPAAAPEQPEPQPEPEPAEENWEQKYQVLQGKYNAEVPRMASDIRALRDEISRMQAAPPPQPEPAPEPQQEKPLVSDQDVVDYGEDLIDLIKRVAKGEVSSVAEQLTPQIQEVRGQVQQSQKRQATNSVYATLDSQVQDWRDINKSAEFLQWLDQSDPYAGDVRKNLLSDAFQKGDAGRVAAFFQGYLAEKQAVAPSPTPTPSAPNPEPAPQVSLDRLAGPAGGPSASEQAAQPNPPQMWTRAQVQAFYTDVANGVFAKDPQRKVQIENSIAAAMQQGRIQ